jgi:hypothetical protein
VGVPWLRVLEAIVGTVWFVHSGYLRVGTTWTLVGEHRRPALTLRQASATRIGKAVVDVVLACVGVDKAVDGVFVGVGVVDLYEVLPLVG